jgi:hypothetical protein
MYLLEYLIFFVGMVTMLAFTNKTNFSTSKGIS